MPDEDNSQDWPEDLLPRKPKDEGGTFMPQDLKSNNNKQPEFQENKTDAKEVISSTVNQEKPLEKKEEMLSKVNTVRIILIVLGFLGIIGVIACVLLLVFQSSIAKTEITQIYPPIVLLVTAILTAILSLLYFLSAKGISDRKNWARILAIVLGAFGLINIPIGMISGILILIYLFDGEVISWFKPNFVKKKGTNTGVKIIIGVLSSCFLIGLILGTIVIIGVRSFIMSMRTGGQITQAQKEVNKGGDEVQVNNAKVKLVVAELRSSEEVYYDQHRSFTSDLNALTKDPSQILTPPVHEGTDTYGISIKADKKSYTIEGHLNNGSIYSCNSEGDCSVK